MRANHVGPGWGTGVSRRQNRLWKPGRAPREHRLRPLISALEGREWDGGGGPTSAVQAKPASGGKLAYFGTRRRARRLYRESQRRKSKDQDVVTDMGPPPDSANVGWQIAACRSPTTREEEDEQAHLSRQKRPAASKEATRAAGLGDRFSGHSLRVGIAQDLGSAGVGLLAIQNAGHWKSPRMSACYRRKLLPTRFAVAWLPED